MIFDYFKNIKKEINDVTSMLNNTSVFNSNVVTSSIDKDTLSQLNMGYNIDDQGSKQMTSGYSSAIDKLANSYNEATAKANALKMAQDGLSESTVKDILTTQKWSEAEINAAISSDTFKKAQQSSTAFTNENTSATWTNVAATKALSAAKKALSIVGGIALSAAISIGISALMKLGDSLITTKKEMKEAAETAQQTIDDIKNSFDTLKSSTDGIKERYAELSQGIEQVSGKNLNLSNDEYEEFLNLSNQLSDLFPSLTKNYDENGNAILGLSGNIDTIVSSLNDLVKAEQDLANQKILENMPDVYENFADDISILNKNIKKYETLSNVLPEDFSINNHGNTSFSLEDINGDVVSADLWDYLQDEINAGLKDIGLEDAFADIQFHNGGYDLEIFGLENTEEYYDKLGKIYDSVRADVLGKIQEVNGSIEFELNKFNKNIYTWLSTDSVIYSKMGEGLQTAVQEMLFDSNWIDDLPDYIDSGNWDEVSKHLEEKYLKEINKLSDTKYEKKFSDLFTTNLKPQDKIDLAYELEEYFKKRKIRIPLDFILDGNNQDSEQNLINRMNNNRTKIASFDPIGYFELKEYTKDFSEEQMNAWLTVTDGAKNAKHAIYLFEQYLKGIESEDINFFTDDNLESIDEYKSKINDLSGYLEKINTEHKLSADDLSKLNTTYEISANSLEEYKQAIIKEMNETANNSEVMKFLAEAIETCNDAVMKSRLESLYEALKNVNIEAQKAATSFEDLNESVSTLESSASLLRDLKEEIDTTGKIDFSNANDIIDVFPEMAEDVALFNAGLMNSKELFKKLEQAFKNSANEYDEAIQSELQCNEEFYDHIIDNLEDWVLDMAEAYDINLSDYKTLNEEKLALDKEYARRKAILDEALLKNEAMNDVLQSPESKDFTGDDFREALNTHEAYLVAQSDLENIQAIIDAVDTAFTTNVSWETFGKNENDSGNGSNSDEPTEIDWADQSLKVLQDEVDKLQTALDNTKGLENQINAIDDLNGALEKLKGGYQSAYDEYETRYTNAISGLGEDIRKKIESGEEFSLLPYDSDTAENIQIAIDSLDKMKEAEEKIKEVSNEIDVNEKVEKSKLLQQSYELKLDTINTKLEDQTLSVEEKNDLLDEQLRLQLAINDLLREQAKYEGDFETVSKLDADDKNKKLQKRLNKLQEKRNQNQVYIDTYNEKLKDPTLTSDDINSLNNGLQSVTNRDFKYQFKEKIKIIGDETWNDYITSLKEKYSEQNMGDKKFIKKHLDEISHYFSHTGMEELYYEYLNSERGFVETDYETKKNERSYHQNDISNNIQDIQNDIELQGGRGTEEQYKDLESLYNTSKDYWTQQKQDAEAMRDSFAPFTAEWDKWNNEVQECDDNIHKCDSSIKDCKMSILKLPLNEVEDTLRDIENKLRDINRDLNDQTELISAATGILDNEIYTQEILKEAVQDQIDALEKENDLRQTNLNIQKAEYELEKAKNQRSSKIFKEGQGWVYESDADEINEAQYNYDNAKYEHKLALLNDHVKVYDEEIKRLNKIKDRWSRINTEAENLVLINKALLYDSGFVGKVLEEDSNFMVGISSTYSSLLSQKSMYEDQQEDYTTLQDIINDTVEMYDLEAIGYEEAKQRIKNAIVQYYPEIVSNYENEEEALERVATKKLEDAGVTEETSETIEEVVKKSNKKLLKSYKKLYEGLDEVFEKLNVLLDEYSENTKTMVDTISESIADLRNQLADVQSGVGSVSITTETTTDVTDPVESSGSKKKKKKKKKSAGKSHSGLELGYIGESSISKDKEAFKYIALSELKNDEVVRVLQQGEAVLTDGQIHNVMENFRKVTQVKVPTLLPNNMQGKSVSFNGDIVINTPIGDSSSLAREIKLNLGNAVLQELYK